MKKRDIFFILIAIMLVSFIFDNDLVILVSNIENNYLDSFFDWITNFIGTIVILLLMTSFFLWETRKREWVLPLWMSFIATGLVTLFLKIIVDRTRPFGASLLFPGWNTSFPSWHAAAAFAGLAILDKEFPKLKWFWIGFASLVAFSRIYIGVHYLSDVMAGVILGYGLGLLMLRLEEKYKTFRNFGKKVI